VRDPFPEGGLRHVLVPPTLGHHQTTEIVFTVLSVEIWETGIVVNIHTSQTAGVRPSPPTISVEDHLGTVYSLETSTSLGARNIQIFTPSTPTAARSLTIKSSQPDTEALVVALAVPRGLG
jgi:hypothetical protein